MGNIEGKKKNWETYQTVFQPVQKSHLCEQTFHWSSWDKTPQEWDIKQLKIGGIKEAGVLSVPMRDNIASFMPEFLDVVESRSASQNWIAANLTLWLSELYWVREIRLSYFFLIESIFTSESQGKFKQL
jgi:hypothetical protein